MSAKIYQAPTELALPNTNPQYLNEWEKLESQYKADLKKYIMSMGYKGKNVGEVIRFRVADGYAEYMILSMRPLGLIHLNLSDGYQYPHIHLMTAKEVNKQLEVQKKMEELFG